MKQKSVFLWGKSGIGKSSIMRQIAAAHNLLLSDARAGQLSELDIRGFPVPDLKRKVMEWLAADFLPKPGSPPGILFLDEMNQGLPATTSAMYQLILDRRIGAYTLPDDWCIVAAGNEQDDRGATFQLPAPLSNRFQHITVVVSPADWQARANLDGIHAYIRAYLRTKPEALHVFDSVTNPRCFPTPRTWYDTDVIWKDEFYTVQERDELIQGTIGEGAWAEFIGFVATLGSMPEIADIQANPTTAMVPVSQVAQHTVAMTLSNMATPKNVGGLMKYASRLPKEIEISFMRSAATRDNAIINTPTYRDWGLQNQAYLR
jgi:hypothetical protein